MKISIPESFWHAGNLSGRSASEDPRQPAFSTTRGLDVDMRRCQFVRPAAVLWCAVYPLLAAAGGTACRLLVPENMGICLYLKSVGLFTMLQAAGVEVDDRGIVERSDRQLILPLTRFTREADVEELANRALDDLSRAGMG